MIAQMAKSALAVLLAGLCFGAGLPALFTAVSYTHLRAHETM